LDTAQGGAFVVAPYPKTPEDIVEPPFRDPDGKPNTQPPKPRDNRLVARLERDDDGTTCAAFDEIR
jgi:hypothetical protein